MDEGNVNIFMYRDKNEDAQIVYQSFERKRELIFSFSCLCETCFSKLVAIKTKYRSRFHPEDDLWLVIPNTDLNLDTIICSLLMHTSH